MGIIYCLSDKSVEQVNNYFTNSYEYNQWFFRLKTLESCLAKSAEFMANVADEELKAESIDSFKLHLKAEIVFTFFHSAEALFSLIIATREAQVPWVQMRGIRFKDLCDFIRDKMVAKALTEEEIRYIFYNGIVDDEGKKKLQKSLSFIKEYLSRMGKIFLENEAYNEYKHGLRVMNREAGFQIIPEGVADPKPVMSVAGTAHIFLHTEEIARDKKDVYLNVSQVTRTFDYELFLRLAYMNFELIRSIFDTRRQKLKHGQAGGEGTVYLYEHANLEELFKEDTSRWFRNSIKYPTSNPEDLQDKK